jgi:hypothetical protein
MGEMGEEILNPKPEIRKKSEARIPKAYTRPATTESLAEKWRVKNGAGRVTLQRSHVQNGTPTFLSA